MVLRGRVSFDPNTLLLKMLNRISLVGNKGIDLVDVCGEGVESHLFGVLDEPGTTLLPFGWNRSRLVRVDKYVKDASPFQKGQVGDAGRYLADDCSDLIDDLLLGLF